jgi:hypothetical protein
MQPDLAEAVRPASCRALAARRTSDWACPMPSLRCTLHIGCSTTCDRDSTVLPWPPTDVPEPAGQQGCRMYPEHCYRLQADAMRGCDLDQIARCANGAARSRHWRRLSGAQAAAAASQPHHMRIARIDPRLAGSPAGANRPAEAALCPESRARISWRHPKYAGFGDSVRCAQQVNSKMD